MSPNQTKNIVITGGTDGMGKETALHLLKEGANVVVIGSTSAKGERFLAEAQQIGAKDRATFIQADLSSIHENQRVIEAISARFEALDVLMFFAVRYPHQYLETRDGLEMIFATYYLSRYILSHGLRDLLEQSQAPVIFNVAAPGGKGEIHWDDLNSRENYNVMKVAFHGSRLNDLSGVAFVERAEPTHIKYILYHPGFVATEGVAQLFDNPAKRLIGKIAGRVVGLSPESGAAPILALLENLPAARFSAYEREKPLPLATEAFSKESAQRLYRLTQDMLRARSDLFVCCRAGHDTRPASHQ
jgi:NAD(P)-dependent dehydrogenase (short-subunit alcohol dehydrogenase family)